MYVYSAAALGRVCAALALLTILMFVARVNVCFRSLTTCINHDFDNRQSSSPATTMPQCSASSCRHRQYPCLIRGTAGPSSWLHRR